MSELVHFSDLSEMVAGADLVLEGVVQTVEPGRILGEGDASIQFAQTTLSIRRLLRGSVEETSVRVEEYGLEGNRPSRPGDHGVYFLHQKSDAPQFYRLVSSQGRFLDNGRGQLVASNDDTSWAKTIEGQSLSQLLTAIEAMAGLGVED